MRAWIPFGLVLIGTTGCATSSHRALHAMEDRNARAQAADNDRMPAAQAAAFAASIECESSCVGAALQTDLLHHDFDPQAEDLRPGNGGFLGHLGAALENVSRRVCMDHARTRCKGLTQVESTRALKVSSGQWSLDFKAGLTERTQYSPYDDAFRSNLVGLNSPPWRMPSSVRALEDEPRACALKITVQRVFGDCMVDEAGGKWRETLRSTKPLGSDSFEVCADPILAATRGLRPQVAREVCAQEIYEQAHLEGGMVLACAAVRWDAAKACAELLGKN